jgi:hypothetical protein
MAVGSSACAILEEGEAKLSDDLGWRGNASGEAMPASGLIYQAVPDDQGRSQGQRALNRPRDATTPSVEDGRRYWRDADWADSHALL